MTLLQQALDNQERRAGVSLASIYAFRMIGLFLIIPIFALHAEGMTDATPFLIGLALGIYGLTQALLQVPFGMVSDRIGRKPVIAAGLLIFAAGSLLAASADGIWGIIAGRALQGAGAISAALMALAADLSREEHRMRMMALIGASIGGAFALSMIAGPLVYNWIGLSGIFAGTAVLALVGIAILYLLVPDPVKSHFHRDAEVEPTSLREVLTMPALLRLDLGIFALHFVLVSVFQVVPLELRDAGLDPGQHWQLYLPVFAAALALMLPFIIVAEGKQRIKPVFLGAIVVYTAGIAAFELSDSLWPMALSLVLFFAASALLESMLPSLISKIAHAAHKGTAMGVYSTSQFLGAFAGGVAGGAAHHHWGLNGVYNVSIGIMVLWFAAAVFMKKPRHLSTYLFRVGDIDEQTLLAVPGVVEAAIVRDEGVAYLKVEKNILDEEKLLSFAVSETH